MASTVAYLSAGVPNLHGKLFWPEFCPNGDRVAVLGVLIDFSSEPAGRRNVHAVRLRPGDRSLHGADIWDRVLVILDATGAAHATGTVTGELVAGGTVAWTPDGRSLLYLVREAGDAAASWTIRSIDAAGGSQSSVLVRRRAVVRHRLAKTVGPPRTDPKRLPSWKAFLQSGCMPGAGVLRDWRHRTAAPMRLPCVRIWTYQPGR